MPDLLTQIEAFLQKHDLSESRFGVLTVNDKNLVRDLREGRDVQMSTAQKVWDFIAEYEPRADAA